LPPAFDESVATLDNRRKSVVGSSADPSKKRNSATVAVADANSLDASKGRRSSTAAGKAAPTAAAADANNLDTSKGRRSSTAAGKAGPTAVAVDANSLDTSKGRRTSGGKATPTGAGEAVAASKGDNLLTVPKGDPIKKKVKPKEKKKPKGPVPGSCRWRFVRFIRQLYMSYVNCCITMPCYSFDVYRWAPEMASYRALFTRLGLAEREVGVFYVFYSRVDQDHSGAISIYELLEFLNVERTDFSKRVFAIFDEDGNGTIDFREFVIALWNYATLTPSSLVLFAFDMYDKDGSGVLELAEIKKMLVEVYGPQYASNPHARQMVLDLHDKMGVALGMPVYMKVTEFESLCKNRPAMLMPAFIFQDALRSRICGTSFWQACMSKRLQLSNGEYVSIATLMQAAVNDEVAQGVIAADRVGKDHEVATKNSSAMNFMKSIGGNCKHAHIHIHAHTFLFRVRGGHMGWWAVYACRKGAHQDVACVHVALLMYVCVCLLLCCDGQWRGGGGTMTWGGTRFVRRWNGPSRSERRRKPTRKWRWRSPPLNRGRSMRRHPLRGGARLPQ
jgi:Ca2+-binding EF-hand superfamily protein